MTSKRDLKKAIRYSISEVAGVCLFTEWAFDNVNEDKISEIILQLAELQETSIQKVSVSYEKAANTFEGTKKEYNQAKSKYFKKCYNALLAQFNEGLTEIVKELNTLTPAAKK